MKACIDAAQTVLLRASACFHTKDPEHLQLITIVDALDCLYDTPADNPALVKFAKKLNKLIDVKDDRGNEP
jgi:hypothetical protein